MSRVHVHTYMCVYVTLASWTLRSLVNSSTWQSRNVEGYTRTEIIYILNPLFFFFFISSSMTTMSLARTSGSTSRQLIRKKERERKTVIVHYALKWFTKEWERSRTHTQLRAKGNCRSRSSELIRSHTRDIYCVYGTLCARLNCRSFALCVCIFYSLSFFPSLIVTW